MKLDIKLEQAIIKAVIEGIAPPSIVTLEELSKNGQFILRSVRYLLDGGAVPPITHVTVFLAATNSFGADKETLRNYFKALKEVKLSTDALALARACRHKETLVSLINLAGKQLTEGKFDTQAIYKTLNQAEGVNETLEPVSSFLSSFQTSPAGVPVPSLPAISKSTGNLQGIWVIGGDPGIGKSTLAWQLVLDCALPSIYYDLDGTGLAWLIERTRQIFPNVNLIPILQNVHYQDTIRTLDANLIAIKPPAIIVIDSVQTLPTDVLHRRTSLDKWIVSFKEIAKRGYTFILISELNRASYGEYNMGSYKETGELEYAGSLCAQLVGNDPDFPLKFYINKNRHGQARGLITQLERDEQKKFWFNEI